MVESPFKNAMLRAMKCWILLVLTLAVGCKNDQPLAVAPSTPPPEKAAPLKSSEIPRSEQGRPQPRLPILKVWIGTNELTTEIALTETQVMNGMMWRTNMAEMEAMLFVFYRPHRAQFWMRNTLLPLSCAYIDPEGTILELHDMKPRDESGIPAGTDQVQYVLEVNQGWFQRHNVAPGALITTERGSLSKTFFRR